MKSRDFNAKSGHHLENCVLSAELRDGVGLEMTLLSLTTRSFRVRASRFAMACFHSHSHGGSRRFPDKEAVSLQDRHEAWFVKIVTTLFVVDQHCLGSYLSGKLSPLVAFEVIRRIPDPNLGVKFLEFSRLNLDVCHCYQTYDWVVRSLCQIGLHDLARLVLQSMRSDGHLPDGLLLGFLVLSFGKAGKIDIVKKLLAEARGKEVRITSFLYNGLLSWLVKENQEIEAVCLFNEHLALQSPPDTWTFNILIQGLCRAGEVDRGFEFLNDMDKFGCVPDVVTYNTLISGFCRINEVERGYHLLQEVEPRTGRSPDVVTYTSVISGFCKLGKMDKASFLFAEMTRSGIDPSVVTFNVLIDGFGKIGNIGGAEAVFGKMVSFGCQPDVVTFSSLIDGYCRTGKVNLALKFWDVMKVRNVSPNVYTYSILINALCKENKIQKARDFLKHLKHRRISPKPFMYNPVIDGFCKAGNVDEANAILNEMEEMRCSPDKITFTILIIGHCMKGRMHEAINIFHKMLAIGCAPDNITVSSLIICLLKAGMPSEASRIVQMASKDPNLDLPSFGKTIPLMMNAEIPAAA
ncbi:hypothetical protein Tsubulata_015444 [Turnera subulata]|uniref:Pentacotripeptide-repeat region of PRORP domain-containing protein n=1 Tax=Turnera subulata TaxID=218843 RepID=A0A9Q0G476_9ROSI|nr:hypothetical protein Tsubulata_015444 [Turnera subulata]